MQSTLTARITLTKSMLMAIPIYVMQTSVIPILVCEKIERHYRKFIWGWKKNGNRISLIKGEDMCKPKHLGGLNTNDDSLIKLA